MVEKLAEGSPETIMNWAKDLNNFEKKLMNEKSFGAMADGPRDKEEPFADNDKVDETDL